MWNILMMGVGGIIYREMIECDSHLTSLDLCFFCKVG